jgi:hypothetical protein
MKTTTKTDIKWTPGPWTLRGADTYRWQIETAHAPRKAMVIARITTPTRGGAAASDANARLISTAPDLYAALEWAMDQIGRPTRVRGQNDHHCDKYERARAALARARGEVAP